MRVPPAEPGESDDSIPYADFIALLRSLRRVPAAPAPPSRIPELTVAMPARNAEPYIGTAIASVLAQQGVELELIVVDDASVDGTAGVVAGIADPRVRLVRNSIRRGIGYCHNLIIRSSRAEAIAHVDADDIVLPGALTASLRTLGRSPHIGQVYSDYFEVDAEGWLSEADYYRRRTGWRRQRAVASDWRRDLLVKGMVVNHLRTYRKSVFDEVGGFDEALELGEEDYDMAVRIADRFDIVHLGRFTYCHRLHGRNTERTIRARWIRSWWARYNVLRELSRDRPSLLGRRRPGVHGLALLGLLHAGFVGTVATVARIARRRL